MNVVTRKSARRVGVFGLTAMVVGLALWGCAKKPETEPVEPMNPEGVAGPQAGVPAGEPIKIGAIFSVTGPASPLGDPEKKTAKMLQEQINSSGGVLGRPIQVIVKDDKSEPNNAAIAAKDLIENEQVVAIIGPSRTPCTMIIKDTCQKAQVPLIACAAGKPITDPVASYVFATPQTNTLAVEKCFTYLKKNGVKKIAVLTVDNGFGADGLANIKAFAKKEGVELVVAETFGGRDTDMTAQMTAIKAKQPGAILIWGTNPGPAIATKNARTLGIDVPILQSHGVANGKFLELAGEAANGVQLPAGKLIVVDQIPEDDPQKEVLTKFAARYREKYGSAPNTFAGHAYDALHLVVKGLEAAGEVDRAKLRDAIEQIRGFVGTGGVFNYGPKDHNGLTVEAFVWVKIQDGKWTLAE